MKIHSDILNSLADFANALRLAKLSGRVPLDVAFVTFTEAGSRSRQHAFEVQLGTLDKTSGPTRARRFKREQTIAGHSYSVYAPTWNEWGYFIAEVFARDSEAIVGPYRGVVDFDIRTHYQFLPSLPTV